MKDALARIEKIKKEIQGYEFSNNPQKDSFQIYAAINYLKQEFELYRKKGTPHQQIKLVQLISETLKLLTKKIPNSSLETYKSVEKLEELCSALIDFQNLNTFDSQPPQTN